jgi:hypothetical protein
MDTPARAIDLKAELKPLLKPSAKTPQVVDVPAMQFLMLDGEGDPNTPETFPVSVGALYSIAYTLKFAIKKQLQIDYPVMGLEGRWWMADGRDFTLTDRTGWRWTLMLVQPEVVTAEWVQRAVEEAHRKKPLPPLPTLRLERFEEGLCAQIMHHGPYSDEQPTIDALHRYIAEQRYAMRDKHHELYLTDPLRTTPANMRTIIRQPIRKG